ncbi:DUF1761 domain-containing protein [Pseudonocardia endophytica]|uniref:Uncharacterized protein DUF1761 n=1 Tax=Pseudonocardia endophytica TaxID=401976 RepID=A0A4R1HI06_PSEEN|nr:DUF1761 domain-containing protein [Pseudonocardia endophytica]TCK20551.1 uncharacterized protein DUF1761 [Pseudonocardia endophytica]
MSAVLATIGAVVAAFVLSSAYYGALGSRLAELSPAYAGPRRPAAATVGVEVVRNVVLAVVLGLLVARLDPGFGGAIVLALGLWLAFPVVLLAGSVFHERVPVALAAIHAGDWLVKLVVVTAIVAIGF